jgi:hypothetical protein
LIRFSLRGVLLELGFGLSAILIGAALASAQPWQDSRGQSNGHPPVYQWHPTDGHETDGHRHDDRRDRRDFRRDTRFASPQVSANWFQRPYPYHLDYYKMRYGGSYAPYFGNLYGTPQVVNYPPYYGPYYGGNGGGYANGYGPPGFAGTPGMEEGSVPGQIQTGESPMKADGEALPVPTR